MAGVILAAISIFATGAFAQGNSSTTRPGWGYGDKNHVHTGPPGQSVNPTQ
jgi:hypothetical protein